MAHHITSHSMLRAVTSTALDPGEAFSWKQIHRTHPLTASRPPLAELKSVGRRKYRNVICNSCTDGLTERGHVNNFAQGVVKPCLLLYPELSLVS